MAPGDALGRLPLSTRALIARELPHRLEQLDHELDEAGANLTQARDVCLRWASTAIQHRQPLQPEELDTLARADQGDFTSLLPHPEPHRQHPDHP